MWVAGRCARLLRDIKLVVRSSPDVFVCKLGDSTTLFIQVTLDREPCAELCLRIRPKI